MENREENGGRRGFVILLVVILILAAVGGFFAYRWWSSREAPPRPTVQKPLAPPVSQPAALAAQQVQAATVTPLPAQVLSLTATPLPTFTSVPVAQSTPVYDGPIELVDWQKCGGANYSGSDEVGGFNPSFVLDPHTSLTTFARFCLTGVDFGVWQAVQIDFSAEYRTIDTDPAIRRKDGHWLHLSVPWCLDKPVPFRILFENQKTEEQKVFSDTLSVCQEGVHEVLNTESINQAFGTNSFEVTVVELNLRRWPFVRDDTKLAPLAYQAQVQALQLVMGEDLGFYSNGLPCWAWDYYEKLQGNRCWLLVQIDSQQGFVACFGVQPLGWTQDQCQYWDP